MLGLCGCGSSSNSSVAAASMPPATENVAVPKESGPTQEDVQKSEFNEEAELAEPETIEPEVAEPEVESEAESPTINIDTSALLTTHVVEYEDQDGYMIRETCQLSPIFREEDMDTVYALWEALGNDMADFPSEESLYSTSPSMRYARDADSCNDLEYIIGTYMIENLTDGFPITPDSPRTYVRALHAEQVSTDDEDHDANAANSFNFRSVSVAMHSDGAAYYGEQDAVVLDKAKMVSDAWGPACFVIALPNGATPNRPNGYRYDKIGIEFGNKAYADLGYDVFKMTYFE